MHNSRKIFRPALWVAIGLTIVVSGNASAETQVSRGCEVHAVAMVAEMKASATRPMSDQEVALVRETAMKSCAAQAGATTNTITTTPAAVVVAPAAPPTPATVAAVAPATADNSFFGTLGAIFSGPTTRKPGNQRLLERSQH
jgi:hypothetical protein